MGTLEFIMWNNCANNCKFCWQRLFDDKTTFLDEKEQLECIQQCSDMIKKNAKGCDLLLVGGEVYSDQGPKVNTALKKLYEQIAEKVKREEVRFLYANTSLTYKNLDNLKNLLDVFEGIEEHLKFTTSYDLEGRYDTEPASNLDNKLHNGTDCVVDRRKQMLSNLAYIHENYPKINVVVNTIITRAVADAVLTKKREEKYDPLWFMDAYPNTVVWVNLIPYIPIEGYTGLDVRFSETIKVLEAANKKLPGYLESYLMQLDLNQDKTLFEYHSDTGFIERTAPQLDCGHNENFKLVNRADECYICRLKDYFTANRDRF